MEGRPELPYYLIGHSAGGQFLVRMAAFLPGSARRIVAMNPGSELFPTRELPFGYGFGALPPALSSDAVLRAYLAAPLTLCLGTADTVADREFDRTPAAMRQGSSRLERGRACYAMARALAMAKSWPFNWRKVEIGGVAHSASRMFNGKEVEDALFGTAP
jgi:pimeloyl-ACP methyl ester carboxylesterase